MYSEVPNLREGEFAIRPRQRMIPPAGANSLFRRPREGTPDGSENRNTNFQKNLNDIKSEAPLGKVNFSQFGRKDEIKSFFGRAKPKIEEESIDEVGLVFIIIRE